MRQVKIESNKYSGLLQQSRWFIDRYRKFAQRQTYKTLFEAVIISITRESEFSRSQLLVIGTNNRIQLIESTILWSSPT